MKTVTDEQLRAQGLAVLDSADHAGVLVTSKGKAVACLLPVACGSTSMIGALRGKLRISGDTRSTGVTWDAES